MSPTLNRHAEIQQLERGRAFQICHGIMFVFNSGLPQMHILLIVYADQYSANLKVLLIFAEIINNVP